MMNSHNNNNCIIDLIDVSNIYSYKNIFSSSQWVNAFIEIYAKKNLQCINCDHVTIFFYLDENRRMVAIGDPFNDFNSTCNCTKFKDLISNMANNDDVFISNTEKILQEYSITETECYISQLENYEEKISKRIYKQYINTQKEVTYTQIPANHPDFMHHLLWLLENRQQHLLQNRIEEENDSYHNEFNDLIIEFCRKSNHSNTIRVEILKSINSDNILAASLNFYADDGIMCYLRACDRNGSKTISYGLVLDLFVMKSAKQDKYPVYDLTRGDEAYKARLGTDKYHLYNQFIKKTGSDI